MQDTELVEVYRAQDVPQAYVIKTALAEAGIRAMVTGDLLQGALGEVPLGWSSAPRLLVEPADADRARAIVRGGEAAHRTAEARAQPDANGETCLACGAPLGDAVATCPVCGWSYLPAEEETSWA